MVVLTVVLATCFGLAATCLAFAYLALSGHPKKPEGTWKSTQSSLPPSSSR